MKFVIQWSEGKESQVSGKSAVGSALGTGAVTTAALVVGALLTGPAKVENGDLNELKTPSVPTGQPQGDSQPSPPANSPEMQRDRNFDPHFRAILAEGKEEGSPPKETAVYDGKVVGEFLTHTATHLSGVISSVVATGREVGADIIDGARNAAISMHEYAQSYEASRAEGLTTIDLSQSNSLTAVPDPLPQIVDLATLSIPKLDIPTLPKEEILRLSNVAKEDRSQEQPTTPIAESEKTAVAEKAPPQSIIDRALSLGLVDTDKIALKGGRWQHCTDESCTDLGPIDGAIDVDSSSTTVANLVNSLSKLRGKSPSKSIAPTDEISKSSTPEVSKPPPLAIVNGKFGPFPNGSNISITFGGKQKSERIEFAGNVVGRSLLMGNQPVGDARLDPKVQTVVITTNPGFVAEGGALSLEQSQEKNATATIVQKTSPSVSNGFHDEHIDGGAPDAEARIKEVLIKYTDRPVVLVGTSPSDCPPCRLYDPVLDTAIKELRQKNAPMTVAVVTFPNLSTAGRVFPGAKFPATAVFQPEGRAITFAGAASRPRFGGNVSEFGGLIKLDLFRLLTDRLLEKR